MPVIISIDRLQTDIHSIIQMISHRNNFHCMSTYSCTEISDRNRLSGYSKGKVI